MRDRVVSANAYLGARPIVEALRLGASIVITGRVADASLTVGPAVYEHGWAWTDWIGCVRRPWRAISSSAVHRRRAVLWTNWTVVPDLADVGYPIADMAADGSFRVDEAGWQRRHCQRGNGRRATPLRSRRPGRVPDARRDGGFHDDLAPRVGRDVVDVSPARGKPATDSYKVSVAYRDGYAASGTLVLLGPDAERKGRFAGQVLLDRLKAAGATFPHTLIECLGAGDCVPGVVGATAAPPEVVMRVAVRGPDKAAVERFTKEFAPLVTAGLPGVTGYTTGRPAVREVFAYWPALIDKKAVDPEVSVRLV